MGGGIDQLERARRLHREGDLDGARAGYEALLEATPEDAELQGLLGVVALQQNRRGEADRLLRRALAAAVDPRILIQNLNYLVILMRDTGRADEARELVIAETPDWPEGVPATGVERSAALWLANALFGYGEAGRARVLLDRAIPERSVDAGALYLDGRLLLEEGDAAGSVGVLVRAAALAPKAFQPMVALCHAQSAVGQAAAARDTAHRIARNWPVLAMPPQDSHRATLLVLVRAPTAIPDPDHRLHELHFRGNYAGEIKTLMRDEYRFVSMFGNLPPTAWPSELPAADLVINNMLNSEAMNAPGRLATVQATISRIGLPVINTPDQVVATTRLKNAEALRGVANLKVPRIEQFWRGRGLDDQIIAGIGARIGYPVIVRRTNVHSSWKSQLTEENKVAHLLNDEAAVREFLARSDWPEFYAVEYVDLKRPDGLYRKIRAAIVGSEIIVTKPAIWPEWLVAGLRGRPFGINFFRTHPKAVEECNRISNDPWEHLGRETLETLKEVRGRIPLDVFGVDFDVDRDGTVVFFEASAAMSFHPRYDREPVDIRLPFEPFQRVDEAFRGLVARRIAEGPRRPE